MITLLWACTGDPTKTDPPIEPVSFVSGPTLTENPAAGLTAWLEVSLDAPSPLRISVSNPDRSWSVTSPVAQDHRLLLTGFRAEVTHPIRIEALDALGRVAGAAEASWTGEPLPAGFFYWDVATAEVDRMEPGVTLVGFGDWLVAVDPQGLPVWYVPIRGSIHEANRLANGDLIVVINRQLVSRFDLSGEPLTLFAPGRTTDQPPTAVLVDATAFHHDVIELPNGNLAALSIERRWIEDYPSSETDPGAAPAAAWVAGDVVVEFTPEGELVREIPLLDRLDPRRIGFDAVRGDYWEDFATWAGDDVKDWSHGNALSYDPGTDTLLVGLRHQDAVVGLDFTTGDLRWIVAPPDGWPAPLQDRVLVSDEPGFVPPFHMHGAKFTPAGTITMFDNGNNRATPPAAPLPDEENYSRALELSLDPESGTFHPVWSWGEGLVPSHYAGSLGDVDVLPTTDNVLVTFGNLAHPDLGGVRLVEVTREGEVVWDLVIPVHAATTFRSHRIAGLIDGL